MPFSNEYMEIKGRIAEQLIAAGWSAIDDLSMNHTAAVAQKDYETVVGTKTAIAYATPTKEAICILGGTYESEGRNVLSTTTFVVTQGMGPDALAEGVIGFHHKTDAVVADTYAMRLLRPK